mmetsp:Transcript_103549/g.302195  ORF Transcript_103549/g.302195 Transcript_103549/m.302195 type:complete len:209 (-) Transcript_103549:217-843(-)
MRRKHRQSSRVPSLAEHAHSAERQHPISRLLTEALKGIREACESRAVEVSVISDPPDVHDLAWHKLHLVVVTRQNHGATSGPDDSLAIEGNGPGVLGPDRSDVGQRDRSALDVADRELVLCTQGRQPHDLLLDLDDVEASDVLDVGHEKAMLGVDRDGDVVAAVNRVAWRVGVSGPKLRVDDRMLVQGHGHGLQEEGRDSNLRAELLH